MIVVDDNDAIITITTIGSTVITIVRITISFVILLLLHSTVRIKGIITILLL